MAAFEISTAIGISFSTAIGWVFSTGSTTLGFTSVIE